ncbi:MAG TPA: hypothetical protein VH141_27900 [Pseudonocardia sp.]|nr:hypothetical protein [Pseudonocardia sp.]
MSSQQAASASVRNAYEILELTMAEADEARRADLLARLTDARRLLEDSKVRVLVVGGPRQGKSALIEALLVSRRETGAPAEAQSHASRLMLVEPDPPTVGAAGPTSPVPRGNPAQAHAVLFVSDASAVLTRPEIEQLRRIQNLCPTIMFVLTKIDSAPHWYHVLEQNQTLLRDAGVGVETWAVSSVARLQGEFSGDENLTESSGIPALRGHLERLCADHERTRLRAVAHHTLAVLAQLRQMLLQRRAGLARPGSLDHARAHAQVIEHRLTALRDRTVRWPALLANAFASAHADTDLDLRRRIQTVRADVEKAIAERRPTREWEVVTLWLRQRLTQEAQQNREFAAQAARTFSGRAAQHFGLAKPFPFDLNRTCPPTELVIAPSAERALPAEPVLTLASSMNILMRAWVGFIMYYLLAGIAHVNLPPWVGLGPAVLMALTAVLEEHKNRLSRRRSQANSALHRYIDDASLKTGNDVSEVLRQLEQQLRESYGTYIDREQGGLETAEHKTRTTVDELEAAPGIVAEIDNGLRYYEELALRAGAMVVAQMMITPGPDHAGELTAEVPAQLTGEEAERRAGERAGEQVTEQGTGPSPSALQSEA